MNRPDQRNTAQSVNGSVEEDTDSLEKGELDTSTHRKQRKQRQQSTRRRLSLDNSCLGAPVETFHNHLYNIQDDYDRHDIITQDIRQHPGDYLLEPHRKSPKSLGRAVIKHHPRRLSLNNRTAANSTFLASMLVRPKDDLDEDLHDSLHSQSTTHFSVASSRKPSTHGSTDESSSSSLDSNDSFCQASVEETANREYIRRDLGASCFFDDADHDLLLSSPLQMSPTLTSASRNRPKAVLESL